MRALRQQVRGLSGRDGHARSKLAGIGLEGTVPPGVWRLPDCTTVLHLRSNYIHKAPFSGMARLDRGAPATEPALRAAHPPVAATQPDTCLPACASCASMVTNFWVPYLKAGRRLNGQNATKATLAAPGGSTCTRIHLTSVVSVESSRLCAVPSCVHVCKPAGQQLCGSAHRN